jgi:uncharacterized membrane protein
MIDIIPNTHPIFVHYTVALIPLAACCYFLGYVFYNRYIGKELALVGRWCLWFGALASIATVSAGFIAYYSVVHDTPSHFAMTIHRNWALVTFSTILFMAIWSMALYFRKKTAGWVFLSMMICTAILVTITAWLGAEVVYRYGIGVQSLPESTSTGHQHSHKNNNTTTSSILENSSMTEDEHSEHGH